MIVKHLTRGTPDGYDPQRQSVSGSATLLVSEWARKAAHELNDKHHNWIEARTKDEFDIDNLSNAQLRDAIDHSVLLMRWQSVREYLPKVTRDFQMIEAYLAYLNANKGYVGRRQVARQQWEAHKLAQKEEMAYKRALMVTLRERSRQFNSASDLMRWSGINQIATDLDLACAIGSLFKKVLAGVGGFDSLDEEDRKRFVSLTQRLENRIEEEIATGQIAPYEGDRKLLNRTA